MRSRVLVCMRALALACVCMNGVLVLARACLRACVSERMRVRVWKIEYMNVLILL